MNLEIKFGTDGIRGKANKFPFNKKALIILGQVIAKWAINKYNKNNPKILPRVLIGHDTRISCNRIKKHLTLGLQSENLNIFDAQIIPTPAVCQLIQEKSNNNFDFGIIISASHNPYYDNGIKIFDSKNNKLLQEDEEFIINLFKNNYNNFDLKKFKINIIKNNIFFDQAQKLYINNLKKLFPNNFLKNIKIVLDCANGATYKIAPEIFEYFGAQVITIKNKPTGKNINHNCGAVHPENLQKKVLKEKALLGLSFDGDGDRLIAVNKFGQILEGDDILAILLTNPSLKNTNTIVGTIMTNHGLDLYLKNLNKSLIRTPVGDKYIAAKLAEKDLLLGGENSGHIIIKSYMNSGDGIFTGLSLIYTVLITNNLELKTFNKTPQVLLNIKVKNKKDLSQEPYNKIIETQKKDLLDGRVIVRYSGTEDLLRIMVEDIDKKHAETIANNLALILTKELNF